MRLSICVPLNRLLDGGLESGAITAIYGPSATGKTNIALLAAANVAALGKKAIYIDTEGGFSSERLDQLCNGQSRKLTDNIIVLEPTDWEQQTDAIRKAERIIAKDNVGIIVMDSIAALWRITIDDKNHVSVNRDLAKQLATLSKLAREHDIPVLVTNQVYAEPETGRIEMSGRNIVKWWSKNVVELSHTNRTGLRLATIKKARSLPEDRSVEFEIAADGLREPRFRLF
jgi:DNA repair protein RadB